MTSKKSTVRSRSAQAGRATHRVLGILAIIVGVGVAVAAYWVFSPGPTEFAGGKHVALEKYQGPDPTGVPPELKSASVIERGKYLTDAADCLVCHTTKGGIPFAGGRAFVLPFGTIYSTNITPDVETGIGSYTDANFLDAVHKGIGRGNTQLYPAMPYPSYAYMSDADALAIKAYLFSLKPVPAAAPRNTLAFPFNQRGLMSIWSAMFNADKRFEPNPERSAEWNRGAYLAEAMGHCGECHTPRNLAFALDNRKKFAGAIQGGWRAYNITQNHGSGVGAWSDAELQEYLADGHAEGRGAASGPMGEVIDESLSRLRPGDVAAIVTYLRTVPEVATGDLPEPRTNPAPSLYSEGMASALPHGQAIYEGACAGCHGWTGVSPVLPSATLTGTRSVNDATATNVAQIIIHGAQRHTAPGSTHMPAFGEAYSDFEIASVANYVTARFGAKGSGLSAADVAKMRAQD